MADVKDGISGVLEGRRAFTIKLDGDVEKTYYIGSPSAKDLSAADWEHARSYNTALKEGIYTQSEMKDILKARGIIGPDYEDSVSKLKMELTNKIIEMERTSPDAREERLALAVEVSRLREALFDWNQRLNGPLTHTCENIASDARTEYLTSVVIQDARGNRLWKTFEEYKNERNLALQMRARFEVVLWMEGLEPDFMDKSPENVVMREVIAAVSKEAEDLSVAKQEAAEAASAVSVAQDTQKEMVSSEAGLDVSVAVPVVDAPVAKKQRGRAKKQ